MPRSPRRRRTSSPAHPGHADGSAALAIWALIWDYRSLVRCGRPAVTAGVARRRLPGLGLAGAAITGFTIDRFAIIVTLLIRSGRIWGAPPGPPPPPCVATPRVVSRGPSPASTRSDERNDR